MTTFSQTVRLTPQIELGGDRMVLLSGPCAVESYAISSEVAGRLKEIAKQLDIDLIFKASFDKANRTSAGSFRGIGREEALEILAKVGKESGLPLITDVHESDQVAEVAKVVDVLQIPAFLCRQTDLLLAAAASGKAVNIKKGQFMAPEDMKYAADKVRNAGNPNVCLTERGASFGYHNLVVDIRSLPIMRQYTPVIFDVTHSVQQPGGMGGSSGGQRQFASYLARAAGAAGVDGYFIESHPNPAKALSDGPNMIPLSDMYDFLAMLKESWMLGRKYVTNKG
ncbi:3-deoxy-8-phosphooctulonate synthase [Shiella aurantiaca]|uniref:3-deoxy-8-phosphooctulonate synthase n=1 Tax=Shiella aurantiaca TaxID=3058365 RepID=UPI00387306A2